MYSRHGNHYEYFNRQRVSNGINNAGAPVSVALKAEELAFGRCPPLGCKSLGAQWQGVVLLPDGTGGNTPRLGISLNADGAHWCNLSVARDLLSPFGQANRQSTVVFYPMAVIRAAF